MSKCCDSCVCQETCFAKVGKPAPKFKAQALKWPSAEFADISLDDFKGKWVCLAFYPLNFTFVCPTEIIAFDNLKEEFAKHNCEVIMCSVDSCFTSFAWCERSRKEGGLGDIKIPMMSDMTHEISRKYGVLVEEAGIALRGTFLIDPEGILAHSAVNELGLGRKPEETLRLLKAAQFTRKHGEVCGAGWEEGQDTIKPSINGAKEYFEKANK